MIYLGSLRFNVRICTYVMSVLVNHPDGARLQVKNKWAVGCLAPLPATKAVDLFSLAPPPNVPVSFVHLMIIRGECPQLAHQKALTPAFASETGTGLLGRKSCTFCPHFPPFSEVPHLPPWFRMEGFDWPRKEKRRQQGLELIHFTTEEKDRWSRRTTLETVDRKT